jgi:hypothetical protein
LLDLIDFDFQPARTFGILSIVLGST